MMKYRYVVRTVYGTQLETALNEMGDYELVNIFENTELGERARTPYFTIVVRRRLDSKQTTNSRFKKIMMALDGRRARNSREG